MSALAKKKPLTRKANNFRMFFLLQDILHFISFPTIYRLIYFELSRCANYFLNGRHSRRYTVVGIELLLFTVGIELLLFTVGIKLLLFTVGIELLLFTVGVELHHPPEDSDFLLSVFSLYLVSSKLIFNLGEWVTGFAKLPFRQVPTR